MCWAVCHLCSQEAHSLMQWGSGGADYKQFIKITTVSLPGGNIKNHVEAKAANFERLESLHRKWDDAASIKEDNNTPLLGLLWLLER